MVTQAKPETKPLTRKDFQSDQEVRWCPGCGDYAILAAVQRFMPSLGIPKEKLVFVSGIGCSSRFPYYMNTYGFHTIHGRAPAVATGIKLANPELSVWMVTGDGDGLSIGGNHLMHLMRRNTDIKVMLFNNRIYGLTKGQYSPTSELGKKTKSTPMGTVDYPVNPISLVLGAEATFVARSIDTESKHLESVLERAAKHKGTAFVEILQNCNVFNDGAWDHLKDKDTKADALLRMEKGKPMLFGKNSEKGIRLGGPNRLTPEVVEIGKDGVTLDQILVHDELQVDDAMAYLLSRLQPPRFPTPIGIFREVDRATYEDGVHAQLDQAVKKRGPGDIGKLLRSGETWEVKP
ncbi:MAG: 2-oxoacid:ferredoxin oxidoreductase subunit beta [Deltaproteobacteria bacterium]|nr:2-oxoacid:ferredoxin oxidoreductase subunit beta [Deltaproteobacteria bacterium]